MSPLLLEQYLKVARKVSNFAVGTGDPSPVTESFRAPDAQSVWLGPGMPFGTRGGIRVQHYFPYDGEYSLRAFLERNDLPKIEGVRFFQTRVEVKAGPHAVIATFPDEFAEREGPVPNVAGPGGPALGGPLDTRGSAIHPTLELRLDNHRRETVRNRGPDGGRGGVCRNTRSAGHGPAGDFRALQSQGRQRHAEPPAHFRMPAGGSGRGARMRGEDHLHDRAARIPA